jgi:hypothetical protein
VNIGVTFDFEKADNTGRFVRGFASVSTVGGKLVEDHQSDVITMDELTKAAHQFITDARVAKAMHDGSQIGEVVESVMVDDAFAKALGASTDKRGWWIGMKITDPKVQKRIASGELKAFSIGGRGTRKKVGA